MTREKPGRAVAWLIEELGDRGVSAKPATIERLQHHGLVPKPRRPRKGDTDPNALWPRGAIEHYAAAVPLMRQRHDCVDLAALTLLGRGYTVEKDTIERAYAKALAFPEDAYDPDDVAERHIKHPQPFMAQFLRHLRTTPEHRREPSEDLVFALTTDAFAFLQGVLTPERALSLLPARFGSKLTDRLAELTPELIDTILRLFVRASQEFSQTSLMQTIRASTVEELLAAQPEAAAQVDKDLHDLGTYDPDCSRCAEGHAIWIAYLIPVVIRASALDWDAIIKSLR